MFLIQNIGDAFVVKIGATQSIKERKSNLSNSLKTEILLIEVIQSDNYMKFEKFLHNHEFIKKFNYPVEMKNDEMRLWVLQKTNNFTTIMSKSCLDINGGDDEHIKKKMNGGRMVLVIGLEEKCSITQ